MAEFNINLFITTGSASLLLYVSKDY